MERKLLSVKNRLMTIEMLRLLKKRYTYRELAKITGLSINVLSRYVRGEVIPSAKRAEALFSSLASRIDLKREVLARVRISEDGFLDVTQLLADITLLKFIAREAVEMFSNERITKVFTAATDGIPLAALIAADLDVDLVFAKKEREVGVDKYLEESFVLDPSAVKVTLYLPKNLLTSKDSVLIVDDVIRSGKTQKALINLAYKAKATVAGVFAIIGVGETWKRAIGQSPPVKVLVEM